LVDPNNTVKDDAAVQGPAVTYTIVPAGPDAGVTPNDTVAAADTGVTGMVINIAVNRTESNTPRNFLFNLIFSPCKNIFRQGLPLKSSLLYYLTKTLPIG
jgi:hypothetical protein